MVFFFSILFLLSALQFVPNFSLFTFFFIRFKDMCIVRWSTQKKKKATDLDALKERIGRDLLAGRGKKGLASWSLW